MEPLAVDDDICILKHETAYTAAGESPVSVCAGDESVASHFALVTAYEDIKKRLRDTERENTLLRRRVKQLEDKKIASRPEAPPSEGPQYVNKAFSAYRGIYIEKEDLQMELNKLKKEKSESERLLMEQLQAKELELLQLKTEMETSQVMKSLNSSQDYWQMDRVSSEHKIDKLQEELERMTVE
uniref:5-azacytidine induced 2 n=1 Tax=Tetraodon nigroviridis TaxID=99883 RepID=H3DP64_TETNG